MLSANCQDASVVHAHDLNLVIAFDRVVAADKQPEYASQKQCEDKGDHGLLMKIAFEQGVVAKDEQAERGEGEQQTAPRRRSSLNRDDEQRHDDGD